MAAYEHLFEPLDLGPLRLRNRVMMSTHGPRLAGRRYEQYLEARASGGVALLGVNCGSGVGHHPQGPGRFMRDYAREWDAILPSPVTKEGIAFFDETLIPAMRGQADAAHRGGAFCVGQLHHSGAGRHSDNMQATVSSSEIPDEYDRQVPRPLEVEEIAELLEAYGHGARRVKEAGMDAVEVHAAHGYLIQQFLSPFNNKRTDRYGGSFDNRVRLLEEIIEAIRTAVPDFPIGMTITMDEMVEGGLGVEEMQQVGKRVQDRLVYFNVRGGTYTGLRGGLKIPYVAPWYIPAGPSVLGAAALKQVVDTPVSVVQRITDPAFADRLISEGLVDFVGMTRALIADPEWANKAREGRSDDIKVCIVTNDCHYPLRAISCTVNPDAGREDEMAIVPAETPRRVAVVGGGPAGMEAARVAAVRGHPVVLYEKAAELGGQIGIIGRRNPHRPEFAAHVEYQEGQLRKAGVEIRLGVEVSLDVLAEESPDVVIVATGSYDYVPQAPGLDSERVVTAMEVLQGAEIGQNVVVVGGIEDHAPPGMIAEYLAEQGKNVEIVTELMTLGSGLEPSTQNIQTKRLLERDVVISTLVAVKKLEDNILTLANTFTGQELRIEEIDTVVLACGSRAETALETAVKGRFAETYAIGDCRAPRRMVHAVLEAARVSRMV